MSISDHTKDDSDGPLIILAFDKAHTLMNKRTTEYTERSNFSELRITLKELHDFSCFSFFMSTPSKIAHHQGGQGTIQSSFWKIYSDSAGNRNCI
jgi:hypothetical protein